MPLVIISVISETIDSVPSVTMSEGTRRSTEHKPLRKPTAAVAPRLATTPTAMASPGSRPYDAADPAMTLAAPTLANAAEAPLERSMPPTIMTGMWAHLMIARNDVLL